MTGLEPKHHYIPVFYLKQWMGTKAYVCEFSRPYDKVKPRRTHPDGTGYVRGLYTVDSLPPGIAHTVETKFMKTTDDLAARAMRVLLEGKDINASSVVKSGWSRFILSLLMRNPEYLARIKLQIRAKYAGTMEELRAGYTAWKLPGDPETFDAFLAKMEPASLDKAGAIFLQNIIDHKRIGTHINGMRWVMFALLRPLHGLLTSDRPVVMSNGIGYLNSFILLPVSPTHIFLATNTDTTERKIETLIQGNRLEKFLNNAVVSQAYRFVYGQTDSQLLFVERRLAKSPIPTARNACGRSGEASLVS